MPSPYRKKNCAFCGQEWQTRSKAARTCSPTCRARLRELEHGPTKGREPREYPDSIINEVREMYESGYTISEIQKVIPGAKVQNIVRRYGIKTRPAIKRDQKGEKNSSWKGNDASYAAFHLRVYVARGRPSKCQVCGTESATRYEWANLTGRYADINDYERMCVSCHKRYDAHRRRVTGVRTSPVRR